MRAYITELRQDFRITVTKLGLSKNDLCAFVKHDDRIYFGKCSSSRVDGFVAKVDDRGRVFIPKKVREHLGAKEGDFIALVQNGTSLSGIDNPYRVTKARIVLD